jgi:sugar O-acyltransferase (sialic acid O-acetyltransferase NeuD family)
MPTFSISRKLFVLTMPPPVELVIVGTGGLAKEAAQLARQMDPDKNQWSVIRYATESASELGKELPYGLVCYLDEDLISRELPCDVVVGVGYPQARRRVVEGLLAGKNLSFPNLIHPSVDVDLAYVKLGVGNMISKGAVLTCDIVIGDFNLLNWNVTVGHDVQIGSFNVINPSCNLSGHVKLGDACLIGTGAQVLEHRSIHSNTRVGAGAVITTSTAVVGGTYVGVPARLVKQE